MFIFYCPKCNWSHGISNLFILFKGTECEHCRHKFNPSEAIFNKPRRRVFSNL